MSETQVSTQPLHVAGAENFPAGTIHLLADYGLQVSNAEEDGTEDLTGDRLRTYDPQPSEFDPTTNPHPLPPNAPPQPADWGNGWRGVPPHRPTNPALDMTVRAQSFPMNVGAAVMLGGCWTIMAFSTVWRNTVQRIKPRLWDAPVGGEF